MPQKCMWSACLHGTQADRVRFPAEAPWRVRQMDSRLVFTQVLAGSIPVLASMLYKANG